LEPQVPEPIEPIASPDSEERELVAALLQKDRKATAAFVSRYADSVYAFVRARLAPRFDAVDDLVQDVFLAAWEGIRQFQGTGPLQGWLMGIARHKVEDYYRSRLRLPDSLSDDELELAAGAVMPDFVAALDQGELQNKTWRVMARMEEPYRMVLIWRYWDKISAREMAQRLGRTEKAIERLLDRARKQFRERWGDA